MESLFVKMNTDFTFNYIVCGLHIGSEIPLIELAEYNAVKVDEDLKSVSGSKKPEPSISFRKSPKANAEISPDCDVSVTISDTQVPFLEEPTVIKPFAKFNAKEFYFELPGVIRMLVRNGSEIRVEILSEDTNFALLSVYQNAIPIALLQRGIIPFRASGVIDADDQVWLFFAPPRSGMTSNTLFLMERGFRFFSDALVALRLEKNSILAAPFGPSLHIWKPVLAKQSIFKPEEVRPIRESILKYVAKVNPEQFEPTECPVRGLIQVEHLANAITDAPINMIDAFETLRNAVYYNHLTAYLGLEPKIFAMLTTMVKQTKLVRVTRPKNKESFHELAEYIDTKIINGG